MENGYNKKLKIFLRFLEEIFILRWHCGWKLVELSRLPLNEDRNCIDTLRDGAAVYPSHYKCRTAINKWGRVTQVQLY